MQVNIHKKECDYSPDYSRQNKAWKIKNTDAFTFFEIEGTPCFIKRFTLLPSAHELILLWQNKSIDGFPFIFDYQSTTEKNEEISFLFLEHLSGTTLKEAIESGIKIRTEQLFRDVLAALETVHNAGFWFTDFNEENIFLETSGHFKLIDIDSCTRLGTLPNADHRQPGGLPGAAQKSACVIIELFKLLLSRSDLIFSDLNGRQLNLLQILVLLASVEMKRENAHIEKISKQNADFKEIAYYVMRRNYKLARQICEDALQNKTAIKDIRIMGEFILGFRAMSPIVEQFEIIDRSLNWQIIGAEKIVLTVNGKEQEVIQTGKFPISRKNGNQFHLNAIGQYGTIVYQSLTLEGEPMTILPKHPKKLWRIRFPKISWPKISIPVRIKKIFLPIIGLLFFCLGIFYTFSKNLPQQYFLLEYETQIDSADINLDIACSVLSKRDHCLKQADSIISVAHRNEWKLEQWPLTKDTIYQKKLNQQLAKSYYLHGKILFLRKNYSIASKKLSEAITRSKTNDKQINNASIVLKKICQVLISHKDKIDSLKYILSEGSKAGLDSLFLNPMIEKISRSSSSQCYILLSNNDFYNALNCFNKERKLIVDKSELKVIDERIANCNYNLGLKEYDRNKFNAAIVYFKRVEKSKQYKGDYNLLYQKLGVSEFNLERFQESINYFEKIQYSIQRNTPEILYYKSQAQIWLDKCEVACPSICRLMEFEKHKSNAKHMLKKCQCNCY